MPLDPKAVQAVFLSAVECHEPAARAAVLDRECATDPELRRRVEALLLGYDHPESLIDRPIERPAGHDITSKKGRADDELEGAGAESPSDTSKGSNPTVGVLDSISATTGAVPRVLLRDEPFGEDHAPIIRPSSGNENASRYRIDGEIARGGMGAVLKGRDPDLGRDVAIKVLLEGHGDNDDMVRRFVEEAQIGGQLQHPGIVPIYELGTFADRRPFFSMKLVKGETLAELLAARPAPADDLPRLLTIFAAIAQTMAYAHTRGVIHRDLKPSNVMVGSFGEVQVMDWGLAKVLARGGVVSDAKAGKEKPPQTMIATGRSGSDVDLSQAGSILGTPSYMAPEQARGEIELISERADVFALGSILAEILTGSPAFTGRSSGEIVRKAARGDTGDAISRLDGCGAESELITLAKDCLAAEPEDRPRDSNVVSERITAYLAGVQERVNAAERERAVAVAKAIEERRRRKVQVALAASVLALAIVVGLAATAYLHQRQSRAAQVELALSETTLLRNQALEASEDLIRWQAAREAIKRVEVALGDEGSAAARLRLDGLRREVETGMAAARRDRELLDALAEIRNRHLGAKPGVTDAAYAEAFRGAGIDVDRLTAEEAAARLRARPEVVVLQVLPYLDSWSLVRRNDEQPAERRQRPLAVARAADSDAYRNGLRALVERPDIRKQGAALVALSQDRQVAELPATSILQLASALREAGEPVAAVSLLNSAAQRYPGDVWINYNLADLLAGLPTRREEAVVYYTAARALRPESAHNLGHLLDQMGRGEDAIATFRALVKVRPGEARNIGCLATILLARQHREEGLKTLDQAIAAARETIGRRPGDAGEHHILGYHLSVRGDEDEAIAAYRDALRIEPGHTGAMTNLVTMLKSRGDQDGIIAVLRPAIRARPDHAWSHEALSAALQKKGDADGAIAEIREAIRLNPEEQAYRTQLSALLKSQRDSTTPSP
jgi:tetratricopeptide (TPR) repeat protein